MGAVAARGVAAIGTAWVEATRLAVQEGGAARTGAVRNLTARHVGVALRSAEALGSLLRLSGSALGPRVAAGRGDALSAVSAARASAMDLAGALKERLCEVAAGRVRRAANALETEGDGGAPWDEEEEEGGEEKMRGAAAAEGRGSRKGTEDEDEERLISLDLSRSRALRTAANDLKTLHRRLVPLLAPRVLREVCSRAGMEAAAVLPSHVAGCASLDPEPG